MAKAVRPRVNTSHIKKEIGVQRYPDGFLMSEVPLGEGMLDVPNIMGALVKGNRNLRFWLEIMPRRPEGAVPYDSHVAMTFKPCGDSSTRSLRLLSRWKKEECRGTSC